MACELFFYLFPDFFPLLFALGFKKEKIRVCNIFAGTDKWFYFHVANNNTQEKLEFTYFDMIACNNLFFFLIELFKTNF